MSGAKSDAVSPDAGGKSAAGFQRFSTRSSFKAVFAAALARRLYPHTGLRADDLAAALGVHGESLRHWLRGENAPEADVFAAMLAFFARAGDHGFVVETLGPELEPFVQRPRVRQALAAIEAAREALREAG